MNERFAHAVMFINKKTRRVEHVGVYSEATPSCSFGVWSVQLFEVRKASYDAASKEAWQILDKSPSYAWLKPVFQLPDEQKPRPMRPRHARTICQLSRRS